MSRNQQIILAVLADHAPGWASARTILDKAKRAATPIELSTHGVAMSVSPLCQRGVVQRRIGGRGSARVTQYRLVAQ